MRCDNVSVPEDGAIEAFCSAALQFLECEDADFILVKGSSQCAVIMEIQSMPVGKNSYVLINIT